MAGTSGGSREVCVFSPCGQFLAVGQLDGEVKVWEAASGKLQQRFSPGGLHARPANCVVWSKQQDASPRKHKKRNTTHLLLAVAKGSEVVVWNVTKGEQQAILSSAHSDAVNTMAWRRGNQVLYSGSCDQHVAEWSIEKGECITKWKADRHSVHCVCCSSEGTQLVTAGRSIKLWNLEDHSLIKKFTGHATPVRKILFVSESLFLSCAESDRVVNIWSGDRQDRTAAASLTCEEEVMSFDIRVVESEQVLQVAVVSDEGNLSLFKFPLTNHVTAPVSAHSTVQFVSTTQKGDTPSPLPVLAANLSPAGVSLAHTSSLRPCFETINFHQSERRVCLLREARGGLLLGRSEKKSKKRSSEDTSITLLGPGNMTLPAPSSKPANRLPEDVPMSDRLPTDETTVRERQPQLCVSSDSLSHLLSQGLQSGDKKLIEEVFMRIRSNRGMLLPTVKQLPLLNIIPLLRHLMDEIQRRSARGGEIVPWVSAVLQAHSAYLMTVPHLLDSLSGFYQLLDARVALFSKLCRVQGKLELLLAQGADNEARPGGGAMGVLTTPLMSLTAGESVSMRGRGSPQGEEEEEGDWSNDSGSVSERTDQSGSEESDQSEDGSEEGEAMETEPQQGELT